MKKIVPMIIITLNRYEHFVKCIESLKKNVRINEIDLYICVDFPPSESYREGYNRIVEYLKKPIEGFNKVNIIYREKNYGPIDNYKTMYALFRKDYDCFIYSEDDNVFAECFIDYMLNALEKYQYSRDVYWISGFSYPIDWHVKANTIGKSISTVSAWGYGSWMKKFDKFMNEFTARDIASYLKTKKNIDYAYKTSPFLAHCMLGYMDKSFSQSDIEMGIYNLIYKKCCVMPIQTCVINNGRDGTGVHHHTENEVSFDYDSQVLFASKKYEIIDVESSNVQDICSEINTFTKITCKEIIEFYVGSILLKAFGYDFFVALIRLIKKIRNCVRVSTG